MVRVLFNGFKTLVQISLAILFYFFKYFVETTSEILQKIIFLRI